MPPQAGAIARALTKFYKDSARDLPWRRLTDPYAIWVSEVLLQQTQVRTVLPRYEGFLRRFPDVERLAAATEAEVCEAFAGLGYYHRARNLHRAAGVVVRAGGKVPATVEELRQLPGIGDYTAAAIASIAFGVPVPAVDGNLVRVLSRIYALPGKAGDRSLIESVRGKAAEIVRHGSPGDINQALMDVGATLCTPDDPVCAACPLSKQCMAHAQGAPEKYPDKKAATVRKPLAVAFAFVEKNGALLLEQRPLEGLWPGLWEPPSATGASGKRVLQERLHARLAPLSATVAHTLSHRDVVAALHPATLGEDFVLSPNQKFAIDPFAMPLSALARKAIAAWRAPTRDADVPRPPGTRAAGRRKSPSVRR